MFEQHKVRVVFLLAMVTFVAPEVFGQSAQPQYLYLSEDEYRNAVDITRGSSQNMVQSWDAEGRGQLFLRGIQCGQILVAEGDSWFSYPLKADILDRLRRKGWVIYSSARHGDSMESILYDERQLQAVYDNFVTIRWNHVLAEDYDYEHQSGSCLINRGNRYSKALLLSMGGNDVVAHTLQILLEHARSSDPSVKINREIKNALFSRLTRMWIEYLVTIMTMCNDIHNVEPGIEPCEEIPILLHGYDYAEPSGKGYRLAGFGFAGPWIRPALEAKGRLEPDESREIITELVDGYNDLLCDVGRYFSVLRRGGEFRNPVYVVDFRNHIEESDGTWEDELHPDRAAAESLATSISNLIQSFHNGDLPSDMTCIAANDIPNPSE